ncbi:B12-binding domain-containing radical SAM protein [Pelovirga terrestris]|uniref:Radical SAM protein n=1 Tax=Pelovirga terrestris TaxID=2771352 RepID=A0A8J6UH99_9BACT|nr:B12-binding domain-containing radical SAM protein [Pelovirga terrestris]MBD1401128.1 radical SAM protein [Pelovirga terrestris]
MRILIVSQHVRESDQAVALAAGCIMAALSSEQQQQTEIITLYPPLDIDLISRHLLDKEPDLIAFSLSLWNRTALLALARHLRAQQPRLFLLAGGPETAGNCAELISAGGLDGVIRGEGELAFAALVDSLVRGRLIAGIDGFVSAAAALADPPAATCPDLAGLPSPWLTGVLPLTPGCGVLWEVARGCHFNCSFCYDAKGHQGVRPFPFARLRRELKLFAKSSVSQIWILDSTFNAPAQRGHKLLQLLIDVAPQIHYHIEAKADLLDSHTIDLLTQLSCSVQIGLQSAHPEILKPLQRRINPQQMRRVLHQLNLAGIVFGLDLIYGLPGDNHQGFCRSLDFALEQQPNQVDIFPLAVLPGTDLHRRRSEFGLCARSTPPYLVETTTSYPTEQIEQSQLLAAAADIFYNRGRAVGFFLPLCDLFHATPATLLQQFADWLTAEKACARAQLVEVEAWRPERILPLQRDFCREQCRRHKQYQLIPLIEDLLHFHYLCAEILLGDDCQPAGQQITPAVFAAAHWQLNPAVFLHFFHYDPADLEVIGGESLNKIAKQLQQDPGQRLLLKVHGEMLIETLDDSLARMLQMATTGQSGTTLLTQLDPQQAEEQALLAAEQGILLPIT